MATLVYLNGRRLAEKLMEMPETTIVCVYSEVDEGGNVAGQMRDFPTLLEAQKAYYFKGDGFTVDNTYYGLTNESGPVLVIS